jgi:hypothetical protein
MCVFTIHYPLFTIHYSLTSTPYPGVLIDQVVLRSLIKLWAIGLLLWLTNVDSVRAEFCRQVDGYRICIVRIDRSAKNYWQYQAMVSTDGIAQPSASYDCRAQLITDADGNTASFRSRRDGRVVCSLYRRRG